MEDKYLIPAPDKERHKLKYRSTECRNCYHPLDISDEFCPNCSQLNSTKKLAFDDFFNEFFAGIFAYDSRFYRTLGVLLFKPGKISKDYIEGKRVRYANPYRFYLSASIIFFLLWSTTHKVEAPVNFNAQRTHAENQQVDSILAAQGEENSNLGMLLPLMDTISTVQYIAEKDLDTMGYFEARFKQWNLFTQYYKNSEIRNSKAALDSLNYSQSGFNQWYYHKVVDAERFSSDSDLFWNYFYSKLPFIIFFYLPLFALFIWLLYIRRPFNYMEHLIFTFHNQTTWFVLFGLAILIDSILVTDTAKLIGNILFLIYLYKAFRKFYGQGRVKTVLKFIIINIIFFILAVIAAIFSLLASFAIY